MAKILIIDDERAIRSTLREILEYEDYEVSDVDNGVDGLELIRKEDFDLVLCDIRPPSTRSPRPTAQVHHWKPVGHAS